MGICLFWTLSAGAASSRLGSTATVGTACTTAGQTVFNDTTNHILVCNGTTYAAYATAGALPIDVDIAGTNKRIIGINAGADSFLGYRGTKNTYAGTAAGEALDGGGAGAGNTLFGYQAGTAITTGNYNTLYGAGTGAAITTGSGNTAVGGYRTLSSNISGSYNTVAGYSAGYKVTGDNNVIIGAYAGDGVTGGSNNVIIGYDAGSAILANSKNLLIGYLADSHVGAASFTFNIGNVIYGRSSMSDAGVGTKDDMSADIRIDGSVGIGVYPPVSAFHVPDGKYLQAENRNTGAPPAVACDDDTERGRVMLDITNNRLYICNGATRLWDYIPLTN